MVQKKRKSKRQTPKTRHKLHRKLKQEILKQKKIEAKHEKTKVKVPTDVLRTDEEIQMAKDIHLKELKRKQTVGIETLQPAYEQLIESCDVIIQLIDARDLSTMKIFDTKPCINLVTKIDLVPDFMRDSIARTFLVWDNNEADLIAAITKAKASIEGPLLVSVVGQRNVGKSTFINNFRHRRVLHGGMEFVQLTPSLLVFDTMGHIDTKEITLSNVARNAIDLALVDVEYFVGEILKRTDFVELAIFYGIGEFSGVKDFLKMYGKRCGMERCRATEVGKRFLMDVSSGRLCFYRAEESSAVDYYVTVRE